MAGDRHHDSAICHIATNLLTRIATSWRTGQPYVIRDVDGRPITADEGKQIVKDRYKVDQKKRVAAAGRRRTQHKKATGQESQRSQSAPTSRPVKTTISSPQVA